jgi:hypothetical protein
MVLRISVMQQSLYPRSVVAALVFVFPLSALADLSETTILQANTALNLDTGAASGSGGDILWTGSSITPQGKAKAENLGALGFTNFGTLTKAELVLFAMNPTTASIPASKLVPGDVFAVVTSGGNIAKVFVMANSGGVITLQLTTYGASSPPPAPVISKVLNNSSVIPLGLPNYGIAQQFVYRHRKRPG